MTGAGAARSFVDALDEPALVVRASAVVVANSAARKLLGTVVEGADVRLAIRHPQALEHILSGRSASTDVTGIGEFGRPWTIHVREMVDGGLLVRMIDRSAAAAAERMRVDFVANASHELRTPLATILGYAETLADEANLDASHRAQFGGVICSEATRMLRIIEDLMDLSRIEADRFVKPLDRFAIGELVAVAADQVRATAANRNCRITVDLPPNLPIVTGDRAQILQLLDNLLTNAVRYGCGDEGCSLQVSAMTEGAKLRIVVADDGIGIAPEHLPRLTERFYRVDPARSRQSGGTGLGLAICKHIVERHKGMLSIASVPGEGTTVVVILPVDAGE